MAQPTWDDQLRSLEGVVDELLATWRPDGATEAEVQDMNKLALSILASGYLCRVHTDARRPIFMPLWNYAINQGGPDPDYVYSTTEVDPDGVYVISGHRGTARFVEITQQTFDMMNMGQLGNGSPVPHTHDLDDLALDDQGRFRVVLSAERPPGHEGDWWPLDPRTRRLLMRKCACDWAHEVDARVAMVGGFALAAWAIQLGVRVTDQWGFHEFLALQILRGMGTMMAMIAAQQMSVSSLPVQMMKDASGLINLVRNVAGAIGLAVLTTILSHQNAVHYLDLAAGEIARFDDDIEA